MSETSSSRELSSIKAYEVERKFVLTPKARAALLDTAADALSPVQLSEFTDEYYDDISTTLTLADLWLRTRDNVWQLKIPVVVPDTRRSADTTVYRELDGETAVWQALEQRGVVRSTLVCFARLHTVRTFFRLEFNGTTVEVVLDECKEVGDVTETENSARLFEHSVGEVEIIVSSKEDVGKAEVVVNGFCELHKLTNGFEEMAKGKLVRYLETNRPSHYAQLVRAGVVS